MMKRWAWASLMTLVLAACVAHEKVGDKAAAVGDWETALECVWPGARGRSEQA